MTPIIKNIADVLVEILEEHADKNQSVEVLKYILTYIYIHATPTSTFCPH